MHLEALQASFLSETNVYLGVYLLFLAAILDLASRWPPPKKTKNKNKTKTKQQHNFNIRNGFVALKLVGLEVLLWSLYHIGQNLGIS